MSSHINLSVRPNVAGNTSRHPEFEDTLTAAELQLEHKSGKGKTQYNIIYNTYYIYYTILACILACILYYICGFFAGPFFVRIHSYGVGLDAQL